MVVVAKGLGLPPSHGGSSCFWTNALVPVQLSVAVGASYGGPSESVFDLLVGHLQ